MRSVRYHFGLSLFRFGTIRRRLLLVSAVMVTTMGGALAQQSGNTAGSIGALASSLTGIVADIQEQALSEPPSQSRQNWGATAYSTEFPTGYLRETWSNGYKSLQAIHYNTDKSNTSEGSFFGSFFVKIPESTLGGTLKVGVFAGEDRLFTSFSTNDGLSSEAPGTKASNNSAFVGGYALYNLGANYAMTQTAVFEGRTNEVGGTVIFGPSSFDTRGVVVSNVAGHIFDLNQLTGAALWLNLRAGLTYAEADGDRFVDPEGQILRPSTQSWTAVFSGTLGHDVKLADGGILTPYFKGELREKLLDSIKVTDNFYGALYNFHFSQSPTVGVAEIGANYQLNSSINLSAALYAEQSGQLSSNQGTVGSQTTLGGRVGAKFQLGPVENSYKDRPNIQVEPWAGLYAGVNGGYGWTGNKADINYTAPAIGFAATSNGFDSSGGLGGGQIGYNWQNGHVVYGLEVDIQGSNIGDTFHVAIPGTFGKLSVRANQDFNYFGTFRGRLGYGFDNTLIYATGGLAYAGVTNQASLNADGPQYGNGIFYTSALVSNNATEVGYSIGGGVEHYIAPAWSAKLEYQFTDFGNVNMSGTRTPGGFFPPITPLSIHTSEIEQSFQNVRLGINYHFGASDQAPLK